MEILAVLIPALDVRPLTPGPTVAAEVHRVNRDPPTREVIHEGRVEARVIAEPMDVDQHGLGRPGRAPGLPEE
jgi:hypothetical protein